MATLSHGYDFSAYQGNTVPKGVFGWVKTSEGINYKNAKFDAQWASALDNWDAPGVYHFAHPEKSTPQKQINMITSMVELEAGKHTVMLDLETSELSQGYTNDWAEEFGEGLWDTFPGVTTVSYFGGGYATNGTGKGLAKYFNHWCFPQYPGGYRLNPAHLAVGAVTPDEMRAINRSQLPIVNDVRVLLSAAKSNWPTSMDEMFMPSGAKQNTGWLDGASFWQFTDNHSPGGIDASVSSLTAAQILGEANPTTEVVMPGDVPPQRIGEVYTYSVPNNSINIIGIVFNSPHKLTYEVAAHNISGKGATKRLTVGGVHNSTDSWPVKQKWTFPDNTDWISIELVSAEGPTGVADWVPTMPGANGKIVRPFWDASHTK